MGKEKHRDRDREHSRSPADKDGHKDHKHRHSSSSSSSSSRKSSSQTGHSSGESAPNDLRQKLTAKTTTTTVVQPGLLEGVHLNAALDKELEKQQEKRKQEEKRLREAALQSKKGQQNEQSTRTVTITPKPNPATPSASNTGVQQMPNNIQIDMQEVTNRVLQQLSAEGIPQFTVPTEAQIVHQSKNMIQEILAESKAELKTKYLAVMQAQMQAPVQIKIPKNTGSATSCAKDLEHDYSRSQHDTAHAPTKNKRTGKKTGRKDHDISDNSDDEIGNPEKRHKGDSDCEVEEVTQGSSEHLSDGEGRPPGYVSSSSDEDEEGNSDDEQPSGEEDDSDGEIDTFLEQFVEKCQNMEDPKGPAVCETLKMCVDACFREKPKNVQKWEAEVLKSKRPENLDSLKLVKTEQELWNMLKPECRTRDEKLQRAHHAIHKGACELAYVAEQIKVAEQANDASRLKPKRLFKACLRGIQALGWGSQQLIFRRRENLRPALDHKYKQMCNESHPWNDFLLGGDLQNQAKKIFEASRIAKQYSGDKHNAGKKKFPKKKGKFGGGFDKKKGFPKKRGSRGGQNKKPFNNKADQGTPQK